MDIGMIGLGRMGGNMAQRLLTGGHRVVTFDRDNEAVQASTVSGATGATSIESLVSQLERPRAVWIMVPSGQPTEDVITVVTTHLSAGDVVIDGGNSNYKDSVRRGATLEAAGLQFLDVGTSGGTWGLTEGYCLMIGGKVEAFRRLEPIFKTLVSDSNKGYGHMGPIGSGHFVKMIHNGIEYGLMQSYAEGFELMEAKRDFDLNLTQIAEIWRHGSVVRSWLLDLTAEALGEDNNLSEIQAFVEDSGEGRWTVEESIELSIPLPVISAALQARFRSRQEQPFGAKLLAAMRNKFGGHAIRR